MPILALGGSGGTRIATGVTQAALARLALRSRSERVRVASARSHAGHRRCSSTPRWRRDVREGLRARGETVKDEPFTGSAIQMIAWERDARTRPVKHPRGEPIRARSGMAAAR